MQVSASSAAPPAPGGYIKDTTTQAFVADVIEASKHQPVLVDFWAPWCGPCKQLTPILEKAVNAAGGAVTLVKMNIDEHPSIPGQLGVQSIPTVIAFKDGRPLDAFMGALSESQIRQFIESLGAQAPAPLGVDIEALLKVGEAALQENDAVTALQNFAAILSVEPEHVGALAGMARTYLMTGELEQAKAVLAQIPQDKQGDAQVTSVLSALELAEKSAAVGDLGALEQKVAANGSDFQARFDLALGLAASGKRNDAVEQLLAILRLQGDWNEHAARTQLLQFFEAWGFADDAAIAGRKKLSSLLFA